MHTSPVVITVTGHGEATYPPERCTVSLTVQFDGPTAERATTPAVETVHHLTEQITALFDSANGPVNWWSLDQVRHSRRRPYNADGIQLPYVYRAAAGIEVKFSQLDAIDAFVGSASNMDGVDVNNLRWALTTKNRDQHILEVRDVAVRDAMTKATAYASSVGRSTVLPIAIADPGMLGGAAPTYDGPVPPRVYAAAPSDTGVIPLKPQHITLVADVHARFEAW